MLAVECRPYFRGARRARILGSRAAGVVGDRMRRSQSISAESRFSWHPCCRFGNFGSRSARKLPSLVDDLNLLPLSGLATFRLLRGDVLFELLRSASASFCRASLSDCGSHLFEHSTCFRDSSIPCPPLRQALDARDLPREHERTALRRGDGLRRRWWRSSIAGVTLRAEFFGAGHTFKCAR